MTLPVRSTVIRIKLTEMRESIDLVQQNLPDSADSFSGMGLLKDGIYKRTEYAIENVFDICAGYDFPPVCRPEVHHCKGRD